MKYAWPSSASPLGHLGLISPGGICGRRRVSVRGRRGLDWEDPTQFFLGRHASQPPQRCASRCITQRPGARRHGALTAGNRPPAFSVIHSAWRTDASQAGSVRRSVMPPRVTPLMEGIAERKRRYERLNDELQKVLEGFRD